MQRTYNQILAILGNFATSHPQVNSHSNGFKTDINQFLKDNEDLSFLFFEPLSMTLNTNTQDFRFRVYSLDFKQKDNAENLGVNNLGNSQDVLSDTAQILTDLRKYLINNFEDNNIFSFQGDGVNLVPVNNYTADYTVGWYMDINVSSALIEGDCDIPNVSVLCPPLQVFINDSFIGDYFNTFILNVVNTSGDLVGEFVDGNWVVPDTGFNPFTVNNSLGCEFLNVTEPPVGQLILPQISLTDENGLVANIDIPNSITIVNGDISTFNITDCGLELTLETAFPILISNNQNGLISSINTDPGGIFNLPTIEVFDGETGVTPVGTVNHMNTIRIVNGDVLSLVQSGDGTTLTINMDNPLPITLKSSDGCVIDTIVTVIDGSFTLPDVAITDDDGLFGNAGIGTALRVTNGTINSITLDDGGCTTVLNLDPCIPCLPINVINSENCDFGEIIDCPTCDGVTWNLRIGAGTTVEGIELLDCEGIIYETTVGVLGEGEYNFCHASSIAPEITNQTGVNIIWTNTAVVCDTGQKYFSLADIPVSDNTGSLGSVAVPTSIVIDGEATIDLTNCVLTVTPTGGGSGINYQRPTWTGQITSYAVGDVGWQASNGTYNWVYTGATTARLDYGSADPFYTLVENNAFGNTFRFTTDNGTPASDGKADFVSGDFTGATDNYIIDHLTGYGWARGKVAFQELWATAVATANGYTLGAYSDFRLPGLSEIESLINWNDEYYNTGNILDRFAFISGNDTTLWLGDTDELTSTANAYKLFSAGDIRRQSKTSTVATGTYICRTHY